jgi:hypothetical protein
VTKTLGLAAIVLLALVVICGGFGCHKKAKDDAPAAWSGIGKSATGGGISATKGDSCNPALALDKSGNPVVAWSDDSSGNYEIYLKRWNGTTWVEMGGSATGGGISSTSGASKRPSLALAPNGFPVVAWSDDTAGNSEIYLKGWDGAKWADLEGSGSGGGISATKGTSEFPSLALDASGNPFVAWREEDADSSYVCVKCWVGRGWTGLGASATGIRPSGDDEWEVENPVLALDGRGCVCIAVCAEDMVGDSDMWLIRWNGQTWGEVCGETPDSVISPSPFECCFPSLALDSRGNPVVAWQDSQPKGEEDIFLRRWNGTTWVGVGGSDKGGGVSLNTGVSGNVSLALDSRGNPVVAWEDYSASKGGDIYLKRWNGASWTAVGTSATGSGISTGSGGSGSPSLALDKNGDPVVAWEENVSGNWEIYVKRYEKQVARESDSPWSKGR